MNEVLGLLSQKPVKLNTTELILYKGRGKLIFTKEELYTVDSITSETIDRLYIEDAAFRSSHLIMLGLLESFAIKIMNGLVDEKALKKSCCLAYCSQIDILYPVIANFRIEISPNYFENAIELFYKWK